MTTLINNDASTSAAHPAMPTPSIYHECDPLDQQRPSITVQDPTPTYEAPMSAPHPVDSKHLTDDVVLAPQNKAEVGRSGTWARGAGTSGPRKNGDVSRNASLSERASVAAGSLTEETKGKLSKAEKKDAKRLSKIIASEGKSETRQLKAALKELGSLQRAQRNASSAESYAAVMQGKCAKEEQRSGSGYLEAKTRHERALANLGTAEERLNLAREQAGRITDMVRKQAEEVDAMRERKATDDREREVKLANLKAGIMS